MIPKYFSPLAAALAVGPIASVTAVGEYDYVIVGSGPGRGSLGSAITWFMHPNVLLVVSIALQLNTLLCKVLYWFL